jgi:ABC-2 type transport system ATP-binding protein
MVVETRALRVTFGRSEALKGVDLQIPEGSVFALLGPNGAGKSTTIRVLMNVLRPQGGDATVLGTDSRRLGAQHFQHIGFVSESQRLPGPLPVRAYFGYLARLYASWDRALERSLCAQFDLPPDRQLKALSHGMRIKALLVGALAFRPKLLVLDEPLSGLDTVTRDEIVGGLLQQVQDTTVLISSHELSEIEGFTTHVAFMEQGRLAIQESIESMQVRFREVNATLSEHKTLPSPVPESWLVPEVHGHRLRFVHARCADEALAQRELERHFGAVRATFEPMSLRAIVGALIQDGRRRRGGADSGVQP